MTAPNAPAPPRFHRTPDGTRLAYLVDGPEAASCGYLWLGGFKSDMRGTKAEALANAAATNGRSMVRFDYSGHGESGGDFEEGSVGRWLAEAFEMFVRHASGRRVVIGSSMGGFLALLLMRALQRQSPADAERVAGLVLVAPAADMTELMWAGFPPDVRREITDTGRYARPSAYGDGPYVITRHLIEEGRQHVILAEGLDVPCPVRILQGEDDPDVPWRHALALYESLRGDDVQFTIVKGGDHRLSTPRDLALITQTAEALCVAADQAL